MTAGVLALATCLLLWMVWAIVSGRLVSSSMRSVIERERQGADRSAVDPLMAEAWAEVEAVDLLSPGFDPLFGVESEPEVEVPEPVVERRERIEVWDLGADRPRFVDGGVVGPVGRWMKAEDDFPDPMYRRRQRDS